MYIATKNSKKIAGEIPDERMDDVKPSWSL